MRLFQDLPVTFLICAGRSGGGFLQSILDSHPEIVMLPMELKFHQFWQLYCDGKSLDPESMVNIWTTKTKISRLKTGVLYGHEDGSNSYSNCNFDDFKKLFLEILKRDGTSRINVFFGLHEAYARSIGQNQQLIKMIIEFTASPITLLTITKDFPDAKFIEIVRDPRANYLSSKNEHIRLNGNLVRKSNGGYSSLLIHILDGLYTQYRCIRNSPVSVNQEKWLVVRHEEMHLKNEFIVQKIAKWLGISILPCLYESTIGGHHWTGNSSTGKPVSGVSPDIVTRWMSEMDAGEKEMVEMLFSTEINHYFYKVDIHRPNSKLRRILRPISGEFSMRLNMQVPNHAKLLVLWNYHPWLVHIIRFARRLDQLILAPVFYFEARKWMFNHLQRKLRIE
jgi:hypothetical protein